MKLLSSGTIAIHQSNMTDTNAEALEKGLFSDESTSNSERSFSCDEGTSFLDENEKILDIEKAVITPLPDEKGRQSGNFQFFGWTIVNTLATIGIVSGDRFSTGGPDNF